MLVLVIILANRNKSESQQKLMVTGVSEVVNCGIYFFMRLDCELEYISKLFVIPGAHAKTATLHSLQHSMHTAQGTTIMEEWEKESHASPIGRVAKRVMFL